MPMRFVERRRFLPVLFFAAVALAAVADATTLAPLSFDSLAQQSSAVARLRCLTSESAWDDGEIWTITRFTVVESHKGTIGGVITVRMLGGRVGNFNSHVDGVPAFRVGEEVYLFLWGHGGEPYRVLGWSQGTFRIVRDGRSGAETVTQESAAGDLDRHESPFRGDAVRKMGMPAFKEKLRMALERRTPGEHGAN
jgi:hypothetical protein